MRTDVSYAHSQRSVGFTADDDERIVAGVQHCSDVTIRPFAVRDVRCNVAFGWARCANCLRVAEYRVQTSGLVVDTKLTRVRRLVHVRLRPLPTHTQADQLLLSIR